MNAYFTTFADVSLPIIIACAGGFLFALKRDVASGLFADLSLYVLGPALVVIVLAESKQPLSTFGDIAAFTAVQTAATLLVGWVSGRLMRLCEPGRAALSLTTVFSNSNNYGLPVLLLAFGTTGFSLGAAYVVGQVILVNTLGLFLAARSTFKVADALRRVAEAPLIYACAVGIVLYALHPALPKGIADGLHLVGDAYPALVLIILGIQIRKMRWSGFGRPAIWVAAVLRMVVVPVISLVVIRVLGIEGLLAKVLLIETAMPAAVNAVVLSEKYGADTDLVTATVSLTTIVSFASLPVWISIIM